MARIISTIILACCIQFSFSQNVGIGTITPNNAAILHINSSNKGVLFPTVSLQSQTDNTTIVNPPFGLMVMNNNPGMPSGRGLYYNASFVGSVPSWEAVGSMQLPYQGTSASDQYAFQVNNTTGTVSSVAVLGFATGGKGIYGSSNSGTGVYASSNSGNALEVNGKIKISGLSQVPGAGKVLTSDANGNATWEGGVAFASMGIQPDGAASFADGEEKKVAFYTEEYDLGNRYNPSSISPYSTFTAPVSGIYHFDACIRWNFSSSNTHRYMYLVTNYNGNINKRATVHYYSAEEPRLTISIDVKLQANEQVYITARQGSGSTQELEQYNALLSASNYFTGRLVVRL